MDYASFFELGLENMGSGTLREWVAGIDWNYEIRAGQHGQQIR